MGRRTRTDIDRELDFCRASGGLGPIVQTALMPHLEAGKRFRRGTESRLRTIAKNVSRAADLIDKERPIRMPDEIARSVIRFARYNFKSIFQGRMTGKKNRPETHQVQ